MAKIPDRAEHQRRFMALEYGDRRKIIRAVNRGRALEDRKLAALAVGVARRQQRFWRFAWLLGPALGLVQLIYTDARVALFNGAVGTATIALLSLWWFTRARRAEQLNTAVVESGRSGSRATGGAAGGAKGSAGSSRRRHLPGRNGRADASDEPAAIEEPDGDGEPHPAPPPPGERPYKPRGRKRRG